MASKVNTKFVVWMGVAVVAVVGVVAVVAIKMTNMGGEQNIARAEEYMKAGDIKKAINEYGRAVNKDRYKVEWVKAWLGSIEKFTPTTRQQYEDMYFRDYLGALRALCEADRKNLEPFKQYLEERYQYVQRVAPSLAGWENLAKEYKDTVAKFQGDQRSKDILRRYSGLARAGMLERNPELDEAECKLGLEDLNAALAVDPKDCSSMLAAASIERTLGQRALKADHQSDADKALGQAIARIDKFAKENPGVLRVQLAVLSDAMNAMQREQIARKETPNSADILRANRPALDDLVAAIKAAPPASADVPIIFIVVQLLTAQGPEGRAAGDALIADRKVAYAKDPNFLIAEAGVEFTQRRYDACIALTKEIIALPDLPVGLDGYLLCAAARSQALRLQADAVFVGWQSEPDAAKRDAWAKRLGEIRGELAAMVGETNPAVLSIEGRLALVGNDIKGARSIITKYNDKTNRSDKVMLLIEADLLLRLKENGAAKSIYERVLQIDPQNVLALWKMGLLETDQQDYANAARHLASASAMMPDNADLKTMADAAAMVAKGDMRKDPVLKAIVESTYKAQGITGDIPGGIAILREALKDHPGEIRLSMQLVKFLVVSKDIEGARAVMRACVEANPKEARLTAILKSLESDSYTSALETIDAAPADETQKNLARWSVLMQAGKPEEARAALAEAVKLSPDSPQVIDTQFEDASMRKDVPALEALTARAQAMNLDKEGGLMYRARTLLVAGKIEETTGILREIVAKDKVNGQAWRLLGAVLIETRKPALAADAFRQALDIKPDDVMAMIGYIEALMQTDRATEALAFARKCENMASGNAEFAERLLSLEAGVPGGDVEKAMKARTRIAEQSPKNRLNRLRLAELLVKSKNPESATPILDGLLKEDPNDIQAIQLKAAQFALKDDVPGAVKCLNDFMAQLPPEKLTEELYINAGRLLLSLGEPDKAKAMLETGRKLQKKDMLIDRELGDMMFGAGKWEDSAAAYQRVLDAGGDDPQNKVCQRVLESYLKLKRFEDMNKLIAKLPPAAQGDPTVLLLQAEAYAQQNDRAKALRAYDQAIAANPKSATGFIKRGEFKFMQARSAQDDRMLKDAEADFEQAIRADAGNWIAMVDLARVYRQTGRDELAVNKYKEAIAIDPNNEALRAMLVGTYEDLGRSGEAAEACEQVVERFPAADSWRIKASQAWGRAGNWAKAAETIAPVWQRVRSPELSVALVEALVNKGDLIGASNVLNTPGLDVEKSLALRMLRARVLAKRGQTAQAAEEIQSALSLCRPDSYEDAALFAAGLLGVYSNPADQVKALDRIESGKPLTGYLSLKANEIRSNNEGSRATAIKGLETLADSSPNDKIKASACSLLGTLAFRVNDWEHAGQWFNRGLKLDPDNIELNNNLAYILANKLNRGAEAIPYAQKAAQAAPQNSGFADTLGTCQLATKDYAQAVRTLTNALRLAVNNAERIPVYIHLGQARLQQGDKIEARRLAAQARDLLVGVSAAKETYEPDLRELEKAIDGK